MSSEFLFGSLSTPAGRLQRDRATKLGFIHTLTTTPIDPRPHEAIALAVTVGHNITVTTVEVFYTLDGSRPTVSTLAHCFCLPMHRNAIQWDTVHGCELEQWSAALPGMAKGTCVHYLIRGTTPAGKTIYCPTVGRVSHDEPVSQTDTDSNALATQSLDVDALDGPYLNRIQQRESPQIYSVVVDEETIPDWFHQSVIYQIFVERFAPDAASAFATPEDKADFHGGTLKGIMAKLDYLASLGITCLWLTPIFPSPTHHGYDATDYGSIEPRLGTTADFQQLLAEAAHRKIKVVLDYVANHCSNQHPAFVAATQSQQSKTYPWFRFSDWPEGYDSFYNLPDLPKFNTDYSEVQDYLINHACHWLEQGVSGFRLDHAHGVSHGFWSLFRAATRAIAPESITFGEITETSPLMKSFAGRMDGCLDFRLAELLRGFFAYGTVSVSELDRALSRHFAYFQGHLALPSFLDNHDMNRFLWIVGGDSRRLRLAALCQFTLPGAPIVYYGTEVRLSQDAAVGRLEETRLPMLWDDQQDPDLLAFYRQLIAFRQSHLAVWQLPRHPVVIEDAGGVYVYKVGSFLVALNNNAEPTTVTLPQEWVVEPAVITTMNSVVVESGQSLLLPAYEGAVYNCA
ncbi:MAG: glycoside hydrolase family 13 protein [Cyanobacteria bacterium J06649_4]